MLFDNDTQHEINMQIFREITANIIPVSLCLGLFILWNWVSLRHVQILTVWIDY